MTTEQRAKVEEANVEFMNAKAITHLLSLVDEETLLHDSKHYVNATYLLQSTLDRLEAHFDTLVSQLNEE